MEHDEQHSAVRQGKGHGCVGICGNPSASEITREC